MRPIMVKFDGFAGMSTFVYFEPMYHVPRKGDRIILGKYGSHQVKYVEWIETRDDQIDKRWQVRIKLKPLRTTIF